MQSGMTHTNGSPEFPGRFKPASVSFPVCPIMHSTMKIDADIRCLKIGKWLGCPSIILTCFYTYWLMTGDTFHLLQDDILYCPRTTWMGHARDTGQSH